MVAVATGKARRIKKKRKSTKKSGVSGFISAEEESSSDEREVRLDEVHSCRSDLSRRIEGNSVSQMQREWSKELEVTPPGRKKAVTFLGMGGSALSSVSVKSKEGSQTSHEKTESAPLIAKSVDGSFFGEGTSKVNFFPGSTWLPI